MKHYQVQKTHLAVLHIPRLYKGFHLTLHHPVGPANPERQVLGLRMLTEITDYLPREDLAGLLYCIRLEYQMTIIHKHIQ